MDPGLARRICSGSLLQFLQRDDFLWNGVPTLGFYGPFIPLVQGYSCAESPMWLAKALLCLHLPEDHPFWTAKENNGFWETMSHNETRVTTLDGPALCMANHEANGITELRTGKIVKDKSDIHGIWNYGKLVFNTKFPWESTPQGKIFGVNWDAGNSDNNANGHADRSADISVDGNTAFLEEDQYSTIRPESQQYVLQYLDENIDAVASFTPNATFWHGEKEGVLYRRQFWEYGTDTETHWRTAIDLADFAMPYGIMRADKIRLFRRPIRLTLGSFGFPDNGTDIQIREKDGCKAIILKGKDYTGKNKQLAFTIMDGWSDIKLRVEFYSNADYSLYVVDYCPDNHTATWGINYTKILVCLWAFLLFFIIMRTRLASELWPLIALLCLASLCCNLLLLTLDEYNYTIWYISRGIEVSSKLFVVSFLIYNIFQELQLSSKLAVHDVLTNIYNRRYFFNSVESLLSRPVVKDFCVMLVDINQFKRINAQWGHRVGDKVLVSIVDIIQQSIRPDDILARLEGEVFGLLFTELNSAQAKIIAERMRKNVELLTGFSNRYDVPEQMTISIGTVFSTGDTHNISLVMTQADKALREAKSEGGNKVIIHHI